MAKILKGDYNLDQVGVGEYVVTLKDRACWLVVTNGIDDANNSFTKQVLTHLDDGAEQFRVKYRGPWTPWLKRLDERTLNNAISHINRVASGVPDASDKSSGLMSAADKAKLDGIPPDADKSPDFDAKLRAFAKLVSQIVKEQYAPKEHEHSEYLTRKELGAILQHFVNQEEFTTAKIMKMIHTALVQYNVSDFKGTENFATKKDIAVEKIRGMMGEVDAARLQGKAASYFATREHAHSEYQPIERAGVGKRPSQTVSGGAFIPNPAKGRLQYYANAGAHVFEAPQLPFEGRVLITNNEGAGVIKFKGFADHVDDLPATVGAQYLVHVIKIGPMSIADVKVLRTGGE